MLTPVTALPTIPRKGKRIQFHFYLLKKLLLDGSDRFPPHNRPITIVEDRICHKNQIIFLPGVKSHLFWALRQESIWCDSGNRRCCISVLDKPIRVLIEIENALQVHGSASRTWSRIQNLTTAWCRNWSVLNPRFSGRRTDSQNVWCFKNIMSLLIRDDDNISKLARIKSCVELCGLVSEHNIRAIILTASLVCGIIKCVCVGKWSVNI